MIRSLALVLALAFSGLAGAVQAQTDTGPVILTLDDARIGQERYLLRLLRLPETTRLIHEDTESCRSDTVERSEACLRSDNALGTPVRPVLVLADALVEDRWKPGLAELACVGGGEAASDPGRQRISLWPRAYGLKGATDFIEDSEALEACIAAARAETAP